MEKDQNLEWVKRIKALADTGLVYAEDEYNKERYEELRELSLRLLGHMARQPLPVLNDFFMPDVDYPTVKVDVRGFVLNDAGHILMAKEKVDGKWTIPGGWADIGFTPAEVAVKEIEEETGLQCSVNRLLAVYDKRMHPHPPQPFYIYKLVFLCHVEKGKLQHGFDMDGAAFFDIEALPELSTDRILDSQLHHLYTMVKNKDTNVYFD
ncbi:NUDIX hydrolase N-terminal domain-containing protein [Maribacter polysaccharolyticus]|uniref:NUDIX hydrolase N-terminal domain-containing protein n=1 Tax=Maribacter polysaccharolyticus TaxID=3020831 RepID=UPI00237F665C|nr:NUDIX hydrolase N-terminal domain-containing protein [Maribacter polysaccharolyticus]MDE3743095.1 NUDIX hydrolase N-terminal domain-containing protein [Maribacter polysaccharolyticus]